MAQDGVIKFQAIYTPAPAIQLANFGDLRVWRRIMYLLQLIGQTPERYSNYGFGNISMRIDQADVAPKQRQFLISGTQTGGNPDPAIDQYVLVQEVDWAQNRVVAEGPVKPSSESMTHGTLYALDKRIRWVMHGHSPEIWQHAKALDIPVTHEAVQYGTPEMSYETIRLYRQENLYRRRIYSMGGHLDGIIAFGRTAEETGQVLLDALTRALKIN